MLRIDESSKTLVGPEPSAPVPEDAPARDELHALISAGWDAFAAEIGQPQLTAAGAAPEPGIDLLAMDEAAGRAAVVIVADGSASDALARALAAAAAVASWDADTLGATDEALQAATPSDSPRMVIVGAHFDAAATRTAGWLVASHGMDLTAYEIQVLRQGAERMMSVVEVFPRAAVGTEPGFVAAVDAAHSEPPPPPPGLLAPPPAA